MLRMFGFSPNFQDAGKMLCTCFFINDVLHEFHFAYDFPRVSGFICVPLFHALGFSLFLYIKHSDMKKI